MIEHITEASSIIKHDNSVYIALRSAIELWSDSTMAEAGVKGIENPLGRKPSRT